MQELAMLLPCVPISAHIRYYKKKIKMPKFYKALRIIFRKLGPGFITGAADDDPSGVATYSIAGAQFGYRLNWLSLFLIPMMFSVQEMCGRIGMTSGMGLAGVMKKILF